jgi:Zn-dependent protease with chaperone function
MLAPALYPHRPAHVPPALTRLPGGYRWRVLAMIAGLFLFLFLYLLFIAAAGFLAHWLLALPIPAVGGRGTLLFLVFKFGGALAAALLGLFLFKGLFKGQKIERSTYVPLQEADHPELFAFIRRVSEETGAPRPRRVNASPEVNAALVYNTSVLNLFFPPRKDLLIGLGLVNVVHLSEFKAVLAHEFGHFAQRSVGLGSYLYVANRVMHDVIFSRDALDRFVDQWSQQDLRFSFPAWGLKGILWLVRKVLSGTYEALNVLHLSLGRQMEFNADNVAVSVSGSDALLHGLYRLDFASECLDDASQSLEAAADQGLFTDDLFWHQSQAAERLRRVRKDERLGLPPVATPGNGDRVPIFQPEDDGIPDRYRTHPTHWMREQNATRFYIPSPADERSPWLLFGNVEPLKKTVTDRFYRHVLERREPYEARPATEVQAFINAEHTETTYDPKYHGLYDDRLLNPGEVDDLPKKPWPAEKIRHWLARWPGPDLEERMKAFRQRQAEYHLLSGLSSGDFTLKDKTFTFRDQQCAASDVHKLFAQVDKELDADLDSFHKLDRQVFLAHWSLARHLDGNGPDPGLHETELLERYRFQLAVQGLLHGLLSEQGRLQDVLRFLGNNSEMEPEDFRRLCEVLEGIRGSLTDNLEDAKTFRTPSLTNVPAGSTLHSLIVDRGDTRLRPLVGGDISADWLNQLANGLDGVLRRVKRVHFKSQGSLLAYQEKLVNAWQAASAVGTTEGQFKEGISS